MRLRVSTPTHVVVYREVTYVQAEDPSGRFGILPGHERYLTVVVPSILSFRETKGGAENYVAVRHGTLRVTKDEVQVAVRDAYASNDLAELQERIRSARDSRNLRSYRSSRSLYQMQVSAWRRLMEYEDVRAR